MNKLFFDISIKNKIFILILIPVIVIILMSLYFIYDGYYKIEKLDILKNGVILSTKISSLVHEIQKERGISILFLEVNSKDTQKRLKEQYNITNKKLQDLNSFIKEIKMDNLNQNSINLLAESLNYTNNIVHVRAKVQSVFISYDELLTYYTKINSRYLELIVNVSKMAVSSVVTRQLIAYLNFLLAKETVGIQKAIGASILNKNEFEEGVRVKFTNNIAEENIFIANFLKYASSDTKNFYKTTIDNESFHKLIPIINKLLYSSKKTHIISNMQNTVGYGGFIHNFKNFVIRRDYKYAQNVELLYKDLLKSINTYKNMKYVNQEELNLLKDIEHVFSLYHKNLPKIIEAIQAKVRTSKSDEMIKVDVKPAITAFNTLSNSLFSVKASVWFELSTVKINLMKEISDFVTEELLETIHTEHDLLIKEFYIIGIITTLLILFLTVFSFFINKNIMQTIKDFSKGIFSFFDYINKKTDTINLLIESNTEIGYISKEVNQNIKRIQVGIEEEKNVIKETIEVLKEFEEGNLSKRVIVIISNEALNELATLLNKMADNMELNISSVLEVLEEYSNFNFTRKIQTKNLKAHLHKLSSGVNTLGDSITSVLMDNKKVGMNLDTIEKQKDNLNNLHINLKKLHQNTKDSIEYSSLIQHSILPDKKIFSKYFKEYFVIWKPKDVVGGDIYLFDEISQDECIFMVIDCTGHGVPGAFVTMLVKALEREIFSKIINDKSSINTASILKKFNIAMKSILKQEKNDSISNAGFDGGIIYYNKKEKNIKFSGANTELFIINNNELNMIKGNRHSIGYRTSDSNYEFTQHSIDTQDNMKFYISTDGFLDQNGGKKSFPFGKRKFKDIINKSHNEKFVNQEKMFLDTLLDYQGNEETNDDITMIAFKI